jgi:hypothetical protein
VGSLTASTFYSNRYDDGMDSGKIEKELWDRLANEPERAYRAFESFRCLAGGERTILAAYRRYVGNPEAAKPSDTWSGWASQFAWRERALAYDDYLARMRRQAYERGIEEEAERHGVAAVLALATLFCVGAARSFVTRRRWWHDGLEMLLVGFLAAAVAYGVGALLGQITGVQM